MRASEFVTEKKKRRKRKVRRAAYGPGPFGGYGFAAGYSGAGGVSGGDGGGVGEASYPGNIGAMEVMKFFQVANSKEKELLKKLINANEKKAAWNLIQKITGVRLQGKEFEIDEDWKSALAALAIGAGVSLSNPASGNVEKIEVGRGDTVYSIAKAFDTSPKIIQKLNNLDKDFTIKAGQELKVPAHPIIDVIKQEKPSKKSASSKPTDAELEKSVTGRPLETFFKKYAAKQGIKGAELTALLAQAAHETHDFRTLKEYGGSLDFRKYDPKHAPRKAKELGNKKAGDGARFKGRGFLQITGRYNYNMVGKGIGVNLVKNPELLEKPEIAAKASLWYWNNRVKPKVDDFKDVKDVTTGINPALKHLDRRKEKHKQFKIAST